MTVRLVVFDLNEKEAAGWSGWTGGAAIACGADGGDLVGCDAMKGCLDEGADEVAHHVMQEAGAGDSVDEEIVLLVPGRVVDGSDVVDWDRGEWSWRGGTILCGGKATGRLIARRLIAN